MTLELAQSTILPFNYTEYAVELQYYIETIERKIMQPPAIVPLTQLRSAIQKLERVGRSIEGMKRQLLDPSFPASRWPVTEEYRRRKIRSLNDRLIEAEREWLSAEGIPGRPWYKHIVYAPGLWAGYGAATFPILTEAVEQAVDAANTNSTISQVDNCPLWRRVRLLDAEMANYVDRVSRKLSAYWWSVWNNMKQ